MSVSAIHLRFRISEVRDIAEHAVTADDRFPSITERISGARATASLVWAEDDGTTFLMSNGVPGLPADPTDPFGPTRVVYPHPADHGHVTLLSHNISALRRGNFAEHFPLATQHSSGNHLVRTKPGAVHLIDEIRAAAVRDPGSWLVLILSSGSADIALTPSQPIAGAPTPCRPRAQDPRSRRQTGSQ